MAPYVISSRLLFVYAFYAFWNFQYFYNPLDGALGLIKMMFVIVIVVVAERVTSNLSP